MLHWLRTEAWRPLPAAEPADLTYELHETEIQFLRNESVQVNHMLQLRPISGLPDTVFIVDFGHEDLSRFTVRRIAVPFTTWSTRQVPRSYVPQAENGVARPQFRRAVVDRSLLW